MTQTEALKLALDALGPTPPDCCGCQTEWQIAITAIKAALEAKDEPVAWMHVQGNHEEPSLRQLDDWEIQNGWKQYPLYTTPPQPVIDESAAKRIATALGWKPQRTWVGLTDEDYIKALELCDFDKDAAFEFFEDKLKELNT